MNQSINRFVFIGELVHWFIFFFYETLVVVARDGELVFYGGRYDGQGPGYDFCYGYFVQARLPKADVLSLDCFKPRADHCAAVSRTLSPKQFDHAATAQLYSGHPG